jgi:predicted TIM-barrel fold metal-dependent hydrolase
MRIITVEEHFQNPEVSARVAQLAGPPPVPVEVLAEFANGFSRDTDPTERLGGNRLAHMDKVGIDVQVVSHGNGSPSALKHPEAVELCRRVNNDLAAQIAEYPDRFRGFATLPLYDPAEAADELRRCVGDLGFVGTLIDPDCGRGR